MKLYLKNHTERYPVEQLQLQLFAQEPSEFCTEPFTGDGTVSSLSRGKQYLTATAKVTYQGKTGFAVNRVRLEKADVRATRRILQRSYYLAALQVLPAAPPWGALSGVRPTKLSTKCLMNGGSEKDAERLLREVYFVSPERARLCVDASRHTVEASKLLDADDLSVVRAGVPTVLLSLPLKYMHTNVETFDMRALTEGGRLLAHYLASVEKKWEDELWI